jgi:hypothetical protein
VAKKNLGRPSPSGSSNWIRAGGTAPGHVERISDRGSLKGSWFGGNLQEILIISLLEGMAQQQAREKMEEELVDDNFTTTQQLSLCLDSHGSTLSFTLETLAQHRTLISQLQDEFEFLRRQGETIETKLDARSPNSSVQSQNEETDSRPEPMLPDLNVGARTSSRRGSSLKKTSKKALCFLKWLNYISLRSYQDKDA